MPFTIEIVKEEVCGRVMSSIVRDATVEEVQEANDLFGAGKCGHSLVRDEASWMYGFRYCALCGEGLGAI